MTTETAHPPWFADGDAGATYLLRDDIGTLSVVHFLDIELTSDPGFQAAYPAETRALAHLDEPRVARPDRYVVGATGGIVAVTRRYVESTPLSALLRRRPRGLDAQTAATVVTDLLAALSALHEQGVPHRRVRPEDVLVGMDGVCVLVDVGLVTRTAPAAEAGGGAAGGREAALDAERQAAMAEDLAAAAALFGTCVDPRRRAPGPTPDAPAPEGVPEQLYAVLARTGDPGSRRQITGAELLADFRKATVHAFDAGWDARGRERLAALAKDDRQVPSPLWEMTRFGRNRQRRGRRGEQEAPRIHSAEGRPAAAVTARKAVVLLVLVAGVAAFVLAGAHGGAAHPATAPSRHQPAGLGAPPATSIGTATATPSPAAPPTAGTSSAPAPVVAPGTPGTPGAPKASASATSDPGRCAPNGYTTAAYHNEPEYVCTVGGADVPVYGSASAAAPVVGYLATSGRTHWFVSQCSGGETVLGRFRNRFWAATTADDGTPGFVSETFFPGGADDQPSAVLPLRSCASQ